MVSIRDFNQKINKYNKIPNFYYTRKRENEQKIEDMHDTG